VQIYCDFSGYSDIAIGIARMMGYDLMINFRQPYFAKSIGEFWHRWHISLSTWFRDYLYIPLGGNRVPKPRYFLNIMIVFLVSGLWHGANWTFAIWGALHGFYLLFGTVTAPVRSRLKTLSGLNRSGGLLTAFQTLTTFSLATIAWVFFRAANTQDAFYILSQFTNLHGFHMTDVYSIGLPRFEAALAFVLIFITGVVDWLIAHRPAPIEHLWGARPFRWAATYACAFATIFFGVFGHLEFIYFQF
jgi:D-alanyl-lipoteichoic acid acyltransferase DltB (MBOAT superfamily)